MLTKEQKNEAYKKCLQNIQWGESIFCCDTFLSENFVENVDQTKEVFTELYQLRTINNENIWFNGKHERIEALKKCIELTK